ncbi:MAG: hypothetical protein LBC88_10395 [Spirochaetaceae bacterium]|jgi:hypothetical protein|nr:hypothetical protein [Spirochaetaceae bacterium]
MPSRISYFAAGAAIVIAMILCLLPLAAAGFRSAPAPGGGYAVLGFGADQDDRETGARLEAGGMTNYLSASSVYALLDNFGGTRRVSLDRWETEGPEAWDPRNDGYAERLRDVFVRDGKRYFFLPFTGRRADMERRLAGILDAPYRLEWFTNAGRFSPLRFAPLSAAAVLLTAFLVLIRGRKAAARFSRRGRGHPIQELGTESLVTLAVLPVLGLLSLAGSGAFALGGILAALAGNLATPARLLLRGGAENAGPSGRFWERGCAAPGLFALAVAAVLCSGAGLLQGFAALSAVTLVTALLVHAREAEQGRRRFTPLPILGKFREERRFRALLPDTSPSGGPVVPVTALPWAVLAAVAALLSLEAAPSGGKPGGFSMGPVPGPEDWAAHAAFQSAFSLRPLGGGEEEPPPWRGFRVESDGLIVPGDEADGFVWPEGFAPDADALAPPPGLFALASFAAGTGPAPEQKTVSVYPGEMAAVFAVLALGAAALAGRLRGARGKDKTPRGGGNRKIAA